MPKGVYIRTTECRKILSLAKMGKNHPNWRKHLSMITKRKLSISNKGQTRTEETKHNISDALIGRFVGKNSPSYGIHRSRITKKKLSLAKQGKNNPLYGKHHSDDTRKKMRLSAIRFIKNSRAKCVPRYNPIACQRIDEYGQKHGYKFQHAENGGEFYVEGLGYWVDGYDKERNVVIEADEPHHKYTKEKDSKRQREIEKHLDCKFIRLKLE